MNEWILDRWGGGGMNKQIYGYLTIHQNKINSGSSPHSRQYPGDTGGGGAEGCYPISCWLQTLLLATDLCV